MRNRILLVEDSAEFQKLIERSLSFKYTVDSVGSLEQARNRVCCNNYSLILLDVMLPDGVGFDFCREIQSADEKSATPIIFLTGKTSLSDKIMGFSLGADDYITKPFDPAELLIRIDHRITKSEKRKYLAEHIRCGPLRLDLTSMAAFIIQDNKETRLDLTPMEFRLMLKLAQNPHRVLSRQHLIDGVWGQGVFIEDRCIDKHVSSIRKKINPFKETIKTILGVGYVFQY